MESIYIEPKRITPENENWFFGYYDNPAFSCDGKFHLAIRVPFMDRMPCHTDPAEIFVINLESGERTKVGQTLAWNFQQSCMLQWHPTLADTIVYNDVDPDAAQGYCTVIQDLKTGVKRYAGRACADIAPDGKTGVAVNFDRIYDFRPGYGYCRERDPFYDQDHPADDGVFIVDLETGKARLILSYERIWALCGGYFGGGDKKILINHITFNTDGSRLVLLVRNFGGDGSKWLTAILTVGCDGADPYLLSDFSYASHYHWRDSRVLAMHSAGLEVGDMGNQLYELTDRTHTGTVIDSDFFRADGHCSYSPDCSRMLYDSYPKPDMHRELYLYDLVSRRGALLGRYLDDPLFKKITDARCDLHPRWSPDGRHISLDSIREGFRAVYLLDLAPAMKALRGGL